MSNDYVVFCLGECLYYCGDGGRGMESMMTPGMWRPQFSLAPTRWRVRVGNTEIFFPSKCVRHRIFLSPHFPTPKPFSIYSLLPSHRLTAFSSPLFARATHKLTPLCESSQRKVTQIGPSRPAKRVRCFTSRLLRGLWLPHCCQGAWANSPGKIILSLLLIV